MGVYVPQISPHKAEDGGSSPIGAYRLPPGRHKLPRDHVEANQRWRLLWACAQQLADRGYCGTTLQGVVAAAAVSKAHFYRTFQGLPDCILATYDMAAGAALSVVEEACESSAGGSRQVPAAVTALLEFLAEEPELASVLTDSALVDVPGLVAVRDGFTARLAQSLSAARRPGARSGATSYEELDVHLVRAARAWACGRLQPPVEATLVGGAGELATLLSAPVPSP